MNESTAGYWDKINQTADKIKNADCLLVGIGAGMSATGGLNYSDPVLGQKWYPEYFRLGKKTIIEIMREYWPVSINEDNAAFFWGFWSRHIYHIRYECEALSPYIDLFNIVKNKTYFLCTTNVDCQLTKAGFDESLIFSPQGDYGLFQCEKPCAQDVYNNESMVITMMENMVSPFEIRKEDIPRCPKCGCLLMPNLRCDDRFVDEPHLKNLETYTDYLNNIQKKKIVLLELGVGYNTPVIIRYPFEAITLRCHHATLVRINISDAGVSKSLIEKSICIEDDIGKVLDLFDNRKPSV